MRLSEIALCHEYGVVTMMIAIQQGNKHIQLSSIRILVARINKSYVIEVLTFNVTHAMQVLSLVDGCAMWKPIFGRR